MSVIQFATVIETLPAVHGVRVVFRDGSESYHSDQDPNGFVRVLVPRAHGQWGASVNLPKVGEQGAVAEIEGGMLLWLGACHWQDVNQVDPDPGLEAHIHDSGIEEQIRKDGRWQWKHPSGLRFTVSEDGEALPELQSKGKVPRDPAPAVAFQMEHPAFGSVTVSADGDVEMLVLDGTRIAYSQTDSELVADVAGSVTVSAMDAVSVSAQGVVEIQAADVARLNGVTAVEILSSGPVNLTALGEVAVQAAGDASIEAAGAVRVVGFDQVAVDAQGPVNLTSSAMVTLSAPIINLG